MNGVSLSTAYRTLRSRTEAAMSIPIASVTKPQVKAAGTGTPTAYWVVWLPAPSVKANVVAASLGMGPRSA